MIKELLKRARRALTEDRPDPWDERPEIEAQMKGLLEEYAAELREEDEKNRRAGMWIFSSVVDHETYLRAAMGLVEEATTRAKLEALRTLETMDEYECGCRCREHQRPSCPLCLAIEKCQKHSEVGELHLLPGGRA